METRGRRKRRNSDAAVVVAVKKKVETHKMDSNLLFCISSPTTSEKTEKSVFFLGRLLKTSVSGTDALAHNQSAKSSVRENRHHRDGSLGSISVSSRLALQWGKRSGMRTGFIAERGDGHHTKLL